MICRSITDIPTLSFTRSLMVDFDGDFKARRSCSLMIVSADVNGFDSDLGMLTL